MRRVFNGPRRVELWAELGTRCGKWGVADSDSLSTMTERLLPEKGPFW